MTYHAPILTVIRFGHPGILQSSLLLEDTRPALCTLAIGLCTQWRVRRVRCVSFYISSRMPANFDHSVRRRYDSWKNRSS